MYAIRSYYELGLPPVIARLAQLPKGLVLVTGPTGSGKSTTLAAIVDECNKTRKDHVLTIEDPIEFVHRSQKALINHREVGRITSYNVCYTKLLRAPVIGLSEEHSLLFV